MIWASPIWTMSISPTGHSNVHTVSIFVIKAPDKSSMFPEGSDWTTMSPLFAVQIGIQLALSGFLTKIGVSRVKQAVLLLSCPLALTCLLLRLSMEAFSACVRVGSGSLMLVSAVPESRAPGKAVLATSLQSIGVSVACEAYFSNSCSSLRVLDSEVAVLVNSVKLVVAKLESRISPSGSWVVSGPGNCPRLPFIVGVGGGSGV